MKAWTGYSSWTTTWWQRSYQAHCTGYQYSQYSPQSSTRYEGICNLYLARDAPPDWARDVVINSKCQSIEVCNALETMLVVHVSLATSSNNKSPSLLLDVCRAFSNEGVETRGCERVQQYVKDDDASVKIITASEEDWSTEYLAPIISIKMVDGIKEAIQHINHHGSGHTDGIVTRS